MSYCVKGYIYKGDLFDLGKTVERLRARVKNLAYDEFAKMVGRMLAEEWDEQTMLGSQDNFNTVFWNRYSAAIAASTPGKSQNYDFSFDLDVYPIVYRKEKVLLIRSRPSRNWHHVLNRTTRMKDCSYWNNTDRPKRISEAEWEERYALWREADKFGGTQGGFTVSLAPSYITPTPSLVADFLPTFEARARLVAINRTIPVALSIVNPNDYTSMLGMHDEIKDGIYTGILEEHIDAVKSALWSDKEFAERIRALDDF